MHALWYLHRRFVLVAGAMLAGLLLLLGAIAVILRGTQSLSRPEGASARSTAGASITANAPDVEPSAATSDVAYWNALPAVRAATSASYPAIDAATAMDPNQYARAFATELFTREYRNSTRDQLISWAQYEDALLRSPNYPSSDWSKVLVDSLTDLTWDDAVDTPIPGDGPWLAMRAQHGWQTVSNVKVSADSTWEQQITDGYQPADPLSTVRDVSLTVIQHTTVSGRPALSRFSVSLQLQLGSSPRHAGYAMAVTNNYVIRTVD
jgi:hypothetical protein